MKRTKSGKILIRVGPDSAKRLARNEAIAKKQRERADQRAAKKKATAARNAAKKAAKAAAAARRRAARKAATKARRKAARDRYNITPSGQRPKRKRPWHPRGPNATAKYTSYARRLERSKKLTATRIDPTTFTCNGYIIDVTAGDNPIALRCTCPDFTQVEGERNWQGSNAGPFNPCKHMMAVRDRLTDKNWSCSGGVCSPDPDGIYKSLAECKAALIPPNFTGGQCVDTDYTVMLNGPIEYVDTGEVLTTLVNHPGGSRLGPLTGLEVSSLGTSNSLYFIGYAKGVYFQQLLSSTGGNHRALEGSGVIITLTGSPDNCGDAPSTCP